MKFKRIVALAFACYLPFLALADVSLAKIFQDNMVLQRGKPCTIWGNAAAGEKITCTFQQRNYTATAAKNGKWKVELPAQNAGGPYDLVFKGNNTISLHNVLFGDVWICGGQSNMQFKVKELAVKETDSILDNNPNLRIFTVNIATDLVPRQDIAGGEWKVSTVDDIQNFSAVAFFFGRFIQQKLNIPIGLISDNLGATSVEEWMSPEAVQQFPQFNDYYNFYLKNAKPIKETDSLFQKGKAEWEKKYYLKDDPGLEQKWYEPATDTSDWKTMHVPSNWEDNGLPGYNGSVWFRRNFDLPDNYKGGGFNVSLGQVDDYNIAWVNGHRIGETFGSLNFSNYNVPDSFLQPKNNVLVVRVFDAGGKGGMYNMFWNPFMAGTWKYKTGVQIDSTKFERPSIPNADLFGSPAILYNANIAPLTQLSIKGFIWYQGEANAGRAQEYKTLFPAMIQDWRKQFKQDSASFLFVQLANFKEEPAKPADAEWAELREAQFTALALPKTNFSSAIDVGEAMDIHPKNKQDVGKRLGLAALATAYNIDTVNQSPRYDHMEKTGDSIIISFKNNFDTLVTKNKYGYVSGFQIAGADSVFYWAKAFIKNKTVVVYNSKVTNPVAVRYAWADNPGKLDLYNSAGLPAVPFRTDNWPGMTDGKKFTSRL